MKIMKNVIIVLWIFITTIIAAPKYTFEYRPAGDLIYHYSCVSSVDRDLAVHSPLIMKPTGKYTSGKPFSYTVSYITPVDPPNDVAKWKDISLSERGNIAFWERKPADGEEFSGKTLSEEPFLFPYFTKKEYEVGEEWEVEIPVPVIFQWDSTCTGAGGSLNIKVKQKLMKVDTVLGYFCAEFEYGFIFSRNVVCNGKTERRRFHCSGIAQFAINEGIVLYDRGKFEVPSHSQNPNNHMKFRHFEKLLRLVHFTK